MIDFLVANIAQIVFWGLALMAVAGGIGVITLRSPVHAALSLLGTFLVIAGLFVLKHAEFLGAVQILVYAGGILVLFLFVIMLVSIKQVEASGAFLSRLAPAAVAAGVVLGVLIAAAMLVAVPDPSGLGPETLREVDGGLLGNTQAVGWTLYRDYLVPFEIVSVILLVAMIAAIVFGLRPASLERGGGEVKE